VLNPPADFVVGEGDRLVLLARSYEETAPAAGRAPARAASAPPARRPPPGAPDRRILVLGWSHRVPALLREFDSYAGERFRIDVLSALPAAEREAHVQRYDARPDRIALTHLDGDYTSPSDLRRVDPAGYGNVILIGSDWLESGEEADARTILGYLLLREILPPEGGPEILVELLDPENLALFRSRPGEVLISPLILSHMLAQVALRPELRSVFDELFGPGGAEISFVGAAHYGVAGSEHRFADLQERAAAHGEIALGVRPAASAGGWNAGVRLNPPKEQRWTLTEADEVVVLTTYE
jgi:ion channel POLLUX/CASTOR